METWLLQLLNVLYVVSSGRTMRYMPLGKANQVMSWLCWSVMSLSGVIYLNMAVAQELECTTPECQVHYEVPLLIIAAIHEMAISSLLYVRVMVVNGPPTGSVITRIIATIFFLAFFLWIPIPILAWSYYEPNSEGQGIKPMEDFMGFAIITAAGIFTQNMIMIMLCSAPLLRLRLGAPLPKSGQNMVKAAVKNAMIISVAGVASGIAFLLPSLHNDLTALKSALSAAFFLNCKYLTCSHIAPNV